MTLARLIELTQKAATRPPREVLARLRQEARRAARRPWSHIYPSLLTERALLSAMGASSIDRLWEDRARAPFFVDPAGRERTLALFRTLFPEGQEAIVRSADRVLRHEFELLGSGPRVLGPELPWLEDFKTGRVWPLAFSEHIEYTELDRPSDVKVPWELSRCQHFPVLGQAYWATGEERYAQEYVAEIRDWIEKNPWGQGVNWACAMDVALRAISWIWGFYFFAESAACADRRFRTELLRSLFLHGQHIATHLEKGPVNGNHYLSDGVGLVFLGLFFKDSPKGREWLSIGRSIVLDEMLLQVTPDGVDFEVSTAYHRLVLELFSTAYLLLQLHDVPIPPMQWERLERMYAFVEAYTKPDGLCPLIGDADDGRVQILGPQAINDHRYLLSTGAAIFRRGDLKVTAGRFWEESFWLLGPIGAAEFSRISVESATRASVAFPEGGFFVLRDNRSHLIIDYGPVGTGGIGGHGHNDILAFELVLDGLPLVTDCGAYLYTASREWRNRFRSTAVHATVQVDGEEINRFISPDHLWQLRNDAQPIDVSWSFGGLVDRVRGAHTGYLRLTSPVRPVREVVFAASMGLVGLRDTVEGKGRHRLTWRFPLAPGLEAEIQGSDVRLRSGDSERWFLPVIGHESLRVTVDEGWVSPSYGVKVPARILTLDGTLSLPHELVSLFSSTRVPAHERLDLARTLELDRIPYHATNTAQQ